ncbi:MAG TPA: hypothetical protein VH394_27865 [Thermoanaerobaculia bacterium]|jgi:hypothetical protein|nr:hypothetical protein [Thermoanaerobaculia bacterium]
MKRFLILIPAVLLVGAALPSSPGQFRFERFNRSYPEVVPEISPIVQGPLTIQLSAPKSNLTLRNHFLRLEPSPGGSHTAELRVEFQGQGWLVADVDVAGFTGTRLQDRVIVPAQAATLEGRVKVTREPGAYVVTTEQLPKQLRVKIQSGVGTQIVSFCNRVPTLIGDLDCDRLNQALSSAVVPLPPAGESYLLEDADLTPQERQQFESYLAASRGQ